MLLSFDKGRVARFTTGAKAKAFFRTGFTVMNFKEVISEVKRF
jgi:hypothetical protein